MMNSFRFQIGDSSVNFLRATKHQWPYLTWEDIDILTSPLFWTFIVLLFGGLFFVGRKTMSVVIPLVIFSGFLGLWGGVIAAYTVLLIPLALIALFRRNRFLAWGVFIMIFSGDLLLTLGYTLCLVEYHKMTSGPGLHKIPGELWEGMQGTFAFLIAYYIFTVIWGIYLYRSKRGE